MTVRQISARNNLNNIPHMLRNLATEIESGIEPAPRTMFLIAIRDSETPPDLFQFGAECSRLEEVGALAACMNMALQTEQA